MNHIYEKLGVPTIVNAKGPATRLSGGLMEEAVSKAMQEATQYCVDMTELQSRASAIISDITGAEAGFVTSGAAAGLLLGTAACVAGLDPGKMNKLPDTSGMQNEIIVVRSQRNLYDHALRTVGVKLVEVGLPDRYSGAGVRDAEAWEIADAINEKTAAIYFVANSRSKPSLNEVTEVAHGFEIPVLVDAAGQVPPVENLKRFIKEGADLVTISGGKAIKGPQGSGILCGRRDLVASAALQNLDQDIFFDQWLPPPGLFDKSMIKGLPQHGIGRACKVGKEQIVALLIALKFFADSSIEEQHQKYLKTLESMVVRLDPKLQSLTEIVKNPESGEPALELSDENNDTAQAFSIMLNLEQLKPAIHCDPSKIDEGILIIRASCMRPGDPEYIVEVLNKFIKNNTIIS